MCILTSKYFLWAFIVGWFYRSFCFIGGLIGGILLFSSSLYLLLKKIYLVLFSHRYIINWRCIGFSSRPIRYCCLCNNCRNKIYGKYAKIIRSVLMLEDILVCWRIFWFVTSICRCIKTIKEYGMYHLLLCYYYTCCLHISLYSSS